MIFATGDCHGDFQRFGSKHFPQQRQMGRDDYMITLGDFGGVWNGSSEERKRLDWLNEKPFTSSAQAPHPSPHRKRQGSLTPLSLLSPRDPLRWVRVGPRHCGRNHESFDLFRALAFNPVVLTRGKAQRSGFAAKARSKGANAVFRDSGKRS